jgi:hypothetical protein
MMARALHNCHHQLLDAVRVYFSSDNTGEHGEYSRRWVIYVAKRRLHYAVRVRSMYGGTLHNLLLSN